MNSSNIGTFQSLVARQLFELVPSNSANVIAKPHVISVSRQLTAENRRLENFQIRTAINSAR